MKLETFFEKFDLFADAPNAVAKMRELVLQLAVQRKARGSRPSERTCRQLWNILRREWLLVTGKANKAPADPNDATPLRSSLDMARLSTMIRTALTESRQTRGNYQCTLAALAEIWRA